MKYTFTERIIQIVSWLSLSGILFSALVAKGTIESNTDMCVPRGIAIFVAGTFCSIVAWAVLRLLLNISRRLRRLEEEKTENTNERN